MKVYVIKERIKMYKQRYFLIIPELQYVTTHFLLHSKTNLKTAIVTLPYPSEDYSEHGAVECFIAKSKHEDKQYIAHTLDISNYPHLLI